MKSRIDFNQIEEIRSKADIVAIIGKYIKLTRRGANYFGICPFHADHNPSLVVSPSKKIWKCFVCGAKGNVFTFTQKYKKISFLEAVKEVAIETGFDINNLSFLTNNVSFLDPAKKRIVDANKKTNDLYKAFLNDVKNEAYLNYLKSRGLNEETIRFFEFGYAPKEEDLVYKILTNKDDFLGSQVSSDQIWNEKELIDAGIIYLNNEERPIDYLIDRITIPIYDNNNYIVGFSGRTVGNSSTKYLNTATTKVFSKGNLLFNFNRVRELNDKRVIIVEGFMDAIALHNCNHKNVLATMGVALTDKHLNLLNSLELETVILCFDNDNAGTLATIENGKKLMLNGFNVYVVGKYDKSIKDVDELMQSKGIEAVDSIVGNRIDFISYLIDLKLNKKISLDEIQTNVNQLLKEMIEYGDVLLRTRHFELIQKLSGINQNDLLTKFNELNKFKVSNTPIKNFNTPRKNLNFNFEINPKEYIEVDQQKEDLKKSLEISCKMNISLTLMKVINITRELIAFLIVHNEYIKQAYYNDLSFSKHFINLPEVKVFNKLIYLYEKDGEVTLNSLNELFVKEPAEGVNEEFFNIIASNDEFEHLDRDDKSCETKYKLLLTNISKAKTYFIRNSKSNKSLTAKDEIERSKSLKELVEIEEVSKK